MKELLSRLIGQQNTLTVNVLFIDFTGSHQKALFLSQLFYWCSKKEWIAKTREEWFNEIRISEISIRRFTKEFEEKGFLKTKVKKFNGNPTKHYSLDFDVLIEQLTQFAKLQESMCSESTQRPVPEEHNDMVSENTSDCSESTDTYTETTTETTSREYVSKETYIVKSDFSKNSSMNEEKKIDLFGGGDDAFEKFNKLKEEEQNILEETLLYFREKTGKKVKLTAPAIKLLILRLREKTENGQGKIVKNGLAQFKAVIDLKSKEWKYNPEMNKYLRFATLFNKEKFEIYLEEARHEFINASKLKEKDNKNPYKIRKFQASDEDFSENMI